METKQINNTIEQIESLLTSLEVDELLNDERICSMWSCLIAIKREYKSEAK